MPTELKNPLSESTVPTVASCWSCGSAVSASDHFCTSCNKVQPPAEVDYFTFFSLPRKLNLDAAALEKAFYRLSRRLHPDVYAQASANEQNWSLEKSSLLNDAYRTLKDPIARTEYLLELEGVKLEEQSRAATDQARAAGKQKQQVVPPDLLEEVFELNMQLEEMRMSKKMGETDEQVARDLQSAKTKFENDLNASTQQLQKIWSEWDGLIDQGIPSDDAQRAKVRDKMVDLLNRRSYIRNLVRDVNEVLS